MELNFIVLLPKLYGKEFDKSIDGKD